MKRLGPAMATALPGPTTLRAIIPDVLPTDIAERGGDAHRLGGSSFGQPIAARRLPVTVGAVEFAAPRDFTPARSPVRTP